MMNEWSLKFQYMPRPTASAEAWVYEIFRDGEHWATLVDEKIRYKTLFKPGKDRHDKLDEIIVPLDGKYWVQSGSWARTLVPGEAAFIPKSVDHDSGTATNLVGTHFLVLLFNPKLGVLDGLQPGGVTLPSGSLFWLKGAFRFLRSQPDTTHFLPLSVLPEFFKSLRVTDQLPSDEDHPDPVVTKAIRLLEQTDTPSLEEMGKEVGLTPAHFQKRFKLAMGFSPNQYANAWKLDAIALQLRKGSTFSLVDLATEYGFNDLKHFRDLFQRRFGVNPSAYRKNPPSSE